MTILAEKILYRAYSRESHILAIFIALNSILINEAKGNSATDTAGNPPRQ